MITVLVVDDHELFRTGICRMLEEQSDIQVIGQAESGEEAIAIVRQQHPNVVLLDVNMPIMDGIETMKYLNSNHPNLKVLALSVNNDEETVMQMLTSGAKGYILKDTSPNLFKQAVDEVYEKGFYYTEMVSNFLIHSLNKNEEQLVLKDREVEFIKLACTEKTYKEIAEIMCLSPKTIDGYRENLFQKLDVKTRIGIVLYAIKHKIIEV